MKNEDEILSRLMSIETTNEEIYKELIRIQKDNLQMRIFIEDIYDFIKFTMQQKNNMENMEN